MALSLLDLPSEIGLEIVDKLPAKDVQRLRGVCKRLKSFVDFNSTKIAAVVLERERKRIVEYANYHVLYADNPSFIEKYTRWCILRSYWNCRDCSNFDTLTMIDHLIPDFQWHVAGPWKDTFELTSKVGKLWMVASQFRETGHAKDTIVNYLVALSEDGRFEFDSATVRQLCDDFLYSREGRIRVPQHHGPQEHITALLPEFPLTTLKVTKHGVQRPRPLGQPVVMEHPVEARGRCSPVTLSKTFSIPQLPASNVFAYYVKSEKMRESLRIALEGTEDAVTMNPIFKAAAMEEMFIF